MRRGRAFLNPIHTRAGRRTRWTFESALSGQMTPASGLAGITLVGLCCFAGKRHVDRQLP